MMNGVLGHTEAPMFVLNLCASTTPVALVQPNSPELKRYTFFVTRRREEGRERFRLHMGYFDSQAGAEALLPAVREVYPAAWAGPAPAPVQNQRSASPRPSAAVELAVAPRMEPAVAVVAVPPTVVVAADLPVAEAPVELSLVDDVPREQVQLSTEPMQLAAMSNVREVIAQLGEPALEPAQELSLLEEGPARPDVADTAIRMVTPEDTQTLRDIKLDTQNQAPPCFAVQLVWSVAPIEMDRLPHLAIFSAYTLYQVEGNRQGRRWYGVRLGFFTDAHAAKQVAYYMKADYNAVVVVPVTVKEQERASVPVDRPAAAAHHKIKAAAARALPARPAGPKPPRAPDMQGFELLPTDKQSANTSARESLEMATMDDSAPVPARTVGGVPEGAKVNRPDALKSTLASQAAASPKAQPGKKSGGKRVVARTQRRAEPGQALALESTLEMLGAGTLTLDEDKAQIDDSSLRRPTDVAGKKTGLRFSRLLGRLADKLGDSRR
jgi:hypothetical protein